MVCSGLKCGCNPEQGVGERLVARRCRSTLALEVHCGQDSIVCGHISVIIRLKAVNTLLPNTSKDGVLNGSASTGSIFLDKPINERVSVEAGYVDFGKATMRATPGSTFTSDGST